MPPVVIAVAAFVVEYAAVISIVGVALTVVGKVTHNETLSKIGGVMSIVGGIGGIAGAMGAGAALAGAGEATGLASTGLEAGVGSAATEGIVGNSIEAVTTEGLGQAANTAANVGLDASMPEVAGEAGNLAGNFVTPALDSSLQGVTEDGLLNSTASTGDAIQQASVASNELTSPIDVANKSAIDGNSSLKAMTANDVAGKDAYSIKVDSSMPNVAKPSGSSSSDISDWWAKQDSTTKNNVLQMGGKAVGSLFEGWTADQKLEFEKQRLALDQDKFNTSKNNLNSQPVIQFKKVTPIGLLNSTKG